MMNPNVLLLLGGVLIFFLIPFIINARRNEKKMDALLLTLEKQNAEMRKMIAFKLRTKIEDNLRKRRENKPLPPQ